MYKNSEGYADPTAGAALSNVMRAYKQQQKKRYADKNRRKVYVVSPYAGDVDGNVCAAVGHCHMAVKEGYMPISGHLLYPQILNGNVPEERDLGLLFGLALLAICDEVWVFGLPSPGMAQEIEEAKRLNKKLRYFEEVGK